jgi:hypothetical protein
MRSLIGGESRLNKSLIESLVQLFGMTVVLRRGGGFIRGNNGSPRESKIKNELYFNNLQTYKMIEP